MNNSRKNYKTMQELYKAHLDRESDYLEKKGENLEETLKEDDSENKKEEKKSVLEYILMPFVFVYNVLIGIPAQGYNDERVHFISGFLKVITYIYVFYNITEISDFILDMGFSDTFKTIFMGVFTIFSIFQFCLGIFTAHDTFTRGPFEDSGINIVTIGGYRTSSSRNLPVDTSDKPYDKTMKYMNAKMTGMSNSKREKYLSDFYGGNLKK